MKRLLQVYLLILFVSLSAAKTLESHSAAVIEAVRVVSSGNSMKIEVKLTGSVTPRVMMAANPDRLGLDLPNTLAEARQTRIAVNQRGIRDLRIALTSSDPVVTRLVVDLDCAHPYGLATTGNTIALTVLPPNPADGNAGAGATASDAMGSDTLAAMKVTSFPAITRIATKHVQVGFKVKYVASGVVYLGGGRNAGLEEGMILTVSESKKGASRTFTAAEASATVAQLKVISVAETSALTEVHEAKRDIKPGDWAYLSVEETEAVAQKRASGGGRKAVQTGTSSGFQSSTGQSFQSPTPPVARPGFTERVRGRIGFDYSGISGSTGSSSAVCLIARSDITHIMGTHWNLEGYWRGRITKQSRTEEQTLQSVLNKTYTMQLPYNNPEH